MVQGYPPAQIIVNKIDLCIFYLFIFYSTPILLSFSPSSRHFPSLHSLTLLPCQCPSLFISSQISLLLRLPRATSITAFFFSFLFLFFPLLLLCSSHSALKPCRNFSGSFEAWMSPVWAHLVWGAARALCDLNCAASLQVSLHGRLVSKRHFGHKLSGALIVKINSDQSRCCLTLALSLSLSVQLLCISSLHFFFCPLPLLALPPSHHPPSSCFFSSSNLHISISISSLSSSLLYPPAALSLSLLPSSVLFVFQIQPAQNAGLLFWVENIRRPTESLSQ